MSNNTQPTSESKLEGANIDRMAEISTSIREALRKSLPTPPEQFMTVMVPGKVVELDRYKVEMGREPSLDTQLNQAILCDDMPVLSTLQMGPTGRSVSRSYAATISKLVSATTPVGITDLDNMTKNQRHYNQGMEILTAAVSHHTGVTLVELYAQKQAKYAQAVTAKNEAFHAALDFSNKLYPNSPGKAREEYLQWVKEHAPMLRNSVQSAYMDWVISGKKEVVEYWFAVVDQDTALARVEQSKAAMRFAVVQDTDGACEYQTVKLQPANWANICETKMQRGKNQTKTADWYTWEINRLEQANMMLTVLRDKPPQFTVKTTTKDDLDEAKGELKKKMEAYVIAEQQYRAPATAEEIAAATAKAGYDTKQAAAIKAEGEVKDAKAAGEADADIDAKTEVATEARNAADDAKTDYEKKLKAAKDAKEAAAGKEGKGNSEAYNAARNALHESQAKFDKLNLEHLANENKTAHNELASEAGKGVAQGGIAKNDALIEKYTRERADLLKKDNQAKASVEDYMTSAGINKPVPDPEARMPAPTEEDYFTAITVEVSSSEENKHTESSATSFSIGASGSYGLFSASISASHSEAHSKATQDLANSSVKISFECMRVDINRSWLRPELFYEVDLVPGPGVKISPGYDRLHQLIDGKEQGAAIQQERDDYSVFSYFPTSFIVACNVVLEISGSTSHLQTYMNSSQTSVSPSVGYGPFSVSGSYGVSTGDTSSTCKTTASGCRIEIKSPQIIGWISEIIPALPRLSKSHIAAANASDSK